MALGVVCVWKTQQCALFQPIYSSYGAFFGHSRVNNLSNPTHREKYVSLSNKRWWLCCPTLTPKKKWFLASLTTSTQGPHRASSTAAFTVYFGNRSSAEQKSLQLRVRTGEEIVRTNTIHFTILQTAARTVPEHPGQDYETLQRLLSSGGQVLLHPPWPRCWPVPTHSLRMDHKLFNPSQ